MNAATTGRHKIAQQEAQALRRRNRDRRSSILEDTIHGVTSSNDARSASVEKVIRSRTKSTTAVTSAQPWSSVESTRSFVFAIV